MSMLKPSLILVKDSLNLQWFFINTHYYDLDGIAQSLGKNGQHIIAIHGAAVYLHVILQDICKTQ